MKSMLPRYLLVPALTLALLAAAPLVRAEDAATAKDKALTKAQQKHDTDKDGTLSDEEKARRKEAAKEKRADVKKEVLEKYDANQNGKLDPDEREKMKAAREAEQAAHRGEKEKRQAERAAEKAANKAAKNTPK